MECDDNETFFNEKWRHLLKKIHDTRNIVHRTMTPQSPSKQAPWDLTQCSQHHQHLQHDAPSALVGESAEQILPRHISCQDPMSKSQTQ